MTDSRTIYIPGLAILLGNSTPFPQLYFVYNSPIYVPNYVTNYVPNYVTNYVPNYVTNYVPNYEVDPKKVISARTHLEKAP